MCSFWRSISPVGWGVEKAQTWDPGGVDLQIRGDAALAQLEEVTVTWTRWISLERGWGSVWAKA